jgi:gliding motility-associated-like protein
MIKKLLLTSVLTILFSYAAFSSHAAGMDISYECISQGTNSDSYKITVKFYRDCEGIPAPSNLSLDYSSSCGSGSATLYQVGSAVNINSTCLSYCNGGNTLGIEQYTYEETITLSHCSNWMLSVCVNARNAAINTIIDPGNQELCIEATLNNTVYCNNSPTFSQYPTPFICVGSYYCYNNGAIETDGDSLVYSLVTPFNSNTGGTVNYIAPYSAINPVGGGSSFDITTGNLCVTPPSIISSVLAIKVSEYRNGVLIGSIIRDIQINVFNCGTVTPPTLTGIDTNVVVDINNINDYTFELCGNGLQNINFDINTINPPSGGIVTMSWNNAVPGATFSITNNNTLNPLGTFNWTPTLADIAGSPYYFTVNVTNDNCPVPGNFSFQYQIILNNFNSIISSNVTDVSCNGMNNGNVNLSVTGTQGPYSYLWDTGDTLQNISNLSGGVYTALITDSFDCSISQSFTINEPDTINISTSLSNISCNGLLDGSIITAISGGTMPYSYLWNNGSTTQNLINIGVGNYGCTITDTNGCSALLSQLIITEPNEMTYSTSPTNVSCYGEQDGAIDLTLNGGVGFITTSWFYPSGVQVNTEDLNGLFSGSYDFTITDANGCTPAILPMPIVITEPPQIIIMAAIQNEQCYGDVDGLIDLTVNGGLLGYTYAWLGPGGYTNNIEDIVGLNPGSYQIIVTNNSNLCTEEANFVVSEGEQIQLQLVVNEATCRGGDGSLQISAVSGNAPYYYSIDGGFSFATIGFNSSVLIDSLFAGNYVVIVKDSLCISDSSLIIAVTPNPIINSVTVINESCCGDDGQIIVFTNNDSAIVKYSIDTLFSWQDSAEFVNLYRGDYLVHIEDANSCIDSMEVYVGVDSVPNINMTTQATDIVCHGDTNGTFRVYYPDSCYDYVLWLYTLFNPQVPIDTGFYFNELIKGYYGVVATSKSGTCLDSSAVRYIDEPTPIVYNEPISSAVYCMSNGLCNGSISLDGLPTGGIPPYQYYANEVYTNIPLGTIDFDSTFFGICPGEYEVQVVDANACVVRDTISVLDSSLYIDSFVVENSSCYGYDNGEITVYAHGGLGPYSYLWNNLDTTQTTDSLSPNSYNVIVTDSAACFALDSVVTIQPDTLLFKIIESGKISETCMGITYDGQIFLEITGGTAPYNYSWLGNSGISGFGSGDTMTSLTYDTITISVYDTNGCIASPSWGTINMTVVDALNAYSPLIFNSVLIENSPMCFGSANGTIQIDVQGVPYSYSIDNGITQSSNNIFTNLISSSYSIVVYDIFGCTDSANVFFEEYDELIINIDSIKHVNCYGGSDGYISVRVSGGIGDFSYFWVPTFDTTASITNLSAVPYMIQLTDSVGCMAFDTIILEEEDPVQSIDLVVNNASCFGAKDGSASIQIIGGMPFENDIYTVSWMNLASDTVASENFADSLASGVYLIAITDSFLCGPFIDTIIVAQPSQFYLEAINIKHNLCYGDDNGKIIVTEFGGIAPYSNYFIADSLNGIVAGNSTVVYTDLIAGDYSLWSVDANGCNSDTLIGIKLGEPGKIIAQTNVTNLSCFQSENGVIDLSILSGTSPYQYQLLDGNTVLAQGNTGQAILLSIYYLYASDFTLHVSDYHACEIDTQVIVSQPDEVVASFVVNNNFGREQLATSFENLSSGADAFVWNFADGISENKDLDDEVVHTFVNQGEYVVQLIAHNSNLSDLCNDTANLIIDVEGYDVFNSFSPNSDNINDIFDFNDWMIKGIDVEIFNRWGQQVYHWIGVDGYWDGRSYNGEKLPEGVYFYIMNAQGVDGYFFHEKGSITLFR